MSARPHAARIAVIGAGGTGCALLPLLYRLTVEGITLIDGDTVEAANLGRQTLYGPTDVGRLKVRAAVQRSIGLADGIHLLAHTRFLDANNAMDLLQGHTVVADCTDDLHARRLIERTCARLNIPLVSAAVHGDQVQVLTLGVSPAEGSGPTTWRQFFPGRAAQEQEGCDMRSVPAEVTTVAAALMGKRIRALLDNDPAQARYMDLLDLRHGQWLRIAAPAAPDEELLATARAQGRGEA